MLPYYQIVIEYVHLQNYVKTPHLQHFLCNIFALECYIRNKKRKIKNEKLEFKKMLNLDQTRKF